MILPRPLPLLALTLASLLLLPASLRAGNLIPEGSFDILNEAGMPEGWKLPDPNWAKNFQGKVSVETEEGDSFLRLQSQGFDKLYQTEFTVQIPQNVHRLRLSYRVRAEILELAENDGKGVGVALLRWWGNEEGKQKKYSQTQWITSSTSGWVDKEDILDVPAGMTTLTLYCAIRHAAATADFNDIVLEPAE